MTSVPQKRSCAFAYSLCLLSLTGSTALLQKSNLGLLLSKHGLRVDGTTTIDVHQSRLNFLQAHHLAILTLTRVLLHAESLGLTTGSSQQLSLHLLKALLMSVAKSRGTEKRANTEHGIMDESRASHFCFNIVGQRGKISARRYFVFSTTCDPFDKSVTYQFP